MNKFQINLKELIEEKNLNKKVFAEKIGIAPSTVYGYFNSNFYPTLKIAEKISEFFNCSLNFMLGLTDMPEPRKKDTDRSFYSTYQSLLKEKQMKNSYVLEKLNMGRNDALRWEKGYIPKTNNLIELAKFFNVSVDYLVGKE